MNYEDAMKIMTPAQFNQLMEILLEKQALSMSRKRDQRVEIVFRNGKLLYMDATDNYRADHFVMDEE